NSSTASLARNGGAGDHGAIFSGIASHISNVAALAGLNSGTQSAAALATTTADADTGLLTLGNSAIPFPPGPSAPTWPAAIRVQNVAGQGPNSVQSKTYPGLGSDNCNGAYVSFPTG